MKKYKELEIILPSFACDKHCPYCTAKTTKWPEGEMSIENLRRNIEKMRNDFSFIYLTLGGNGEPTLYPLEILEEIVKVFDDFPIPIKRVLTSGNVFRDESKEKHEMFLKHGWKFEVTAAYTDIGRDMSLLGYNHKYYFRKQFRDSPVFLNYVLLKDNLPNMVQEIGRWFSDYPNIERISCKLLNVNTRENGTSNQISGWIEENAIPKSCRETVKSILDENFEFISHEFDSLNYKHSSGKDIHFSWKNGKYGLHDLVWYCDGFVDYHLNSVNPWEA